MKAKDLLARGYFPKELIPPFNALQFGQSSERIKKSIGRIPNYQSQTSKPITFSIPRVHTSRRKISIPNPHNQFLLVCEIEKHWDSIKKKLETSAHSKSLPIISINKEERAVKSKYNYSDILKMKVINAVTSNYLVYADISRFHGTIYTHCIPWAIHTKKVAKKHRSDNYYGNKLDKYIRNAQDRQTLGIPTGPDSSHIIAELISVDIDRMIKKSIDNYIKWFRYIDDYYFFCDTLSDTEMIITQLTKTLSEYELELNSDKTKISRLPIPFEKEWVSDLRLFIFSSNKSKQKMNLIDYFSRLFHYSKEYPNDFVIKYGISRIKDLKFHKSNWRIYQSLLMQSMIAEPSVMKIILEILLKYTAEGYTLRKAELKKTIYVLLNYHCLHNNVYEILWGLWIARSFCIKLNKEYTKKVAKVDNALIGVLATDMMKTRYMNQNVDTPLWSQHKNAESLYNGYWLYSYEAYIRGWTDGADKYLEESDFFKMLYKYNVNFYDNTRQIEVGSFEDFEDLTIIKIYSEIKKLQRDISNLESTKIEEDSEIVINKLSGLIEELPNSNEY